MGHHRIGAAIFTAVCLAVGPPAVASLNSEASIKAAVSDYVGALYEVAPEKIEQSVSPDLDKIGVQFPAGEARWSSMSRDELSRLALRYNADGHVAQDAIREIEVLDHQTHIASVKLTAHWGTDYLLLSKGGDGRWVIRQVMWEGRRAVTSPASPGSTG